jgi:hypothetical protein
MGFAVGFIWAFYPYYVFIYRETHLMSNMFEFRSLMNVGPDIYDDVGICGGQANELPGTRCF